MCAAETSGPIAYVNGEFFPEHEARISIYDLGFQEGEAVYDTARTFEGRLFKNEEHVDRLLRSCKYLRLDPVLTRAEWLQISERVAEENMKHVGPHGDLWVTCRVARGVQRDGFPTGSTTIVDTEPLPFVERASLYRDGIAAVVPAVRRTPPWAVSPRAKTHNYINLMLAHHEVRAHSPNDWALMLDENGNLAEGYGCNVFLVSKGELLTPRSRYVLPGISRATVLELADQLGIPAQEADLDLYDAAVAAEAFFTSTSLCLCPVSSINGHRLGDGEVPGPITSSLLDAYSDLAGLDISAQYLAHLE